MKVLIINKSATKGGAAIAAFRLFKALKSFGVDVNMLVEEKSDIEEVISLSDNWLNEKKTFIRFVKERIYFLPHEKNKEVRFQFSPAKAGIAIHNHPLVQEADIIHLHWINHGFLSLKTMNLLFQLGKPVVWTLHDMWAFTGGCHYAGHCSNYKKECMQCPMLKNPSQNDISNTLFHHKKKLYDYHNIHPVTCSQWLQQEAMQSTLLQDKKTNAIANPIDTDVFKPQNKTTCQQHFNLPTNKKLLLFGAANINDKRKGIQFLLNALQRLSDNHPELKDEVELIIFGKSNAEFLSQFPFTTHNLDYVSSPEEIVMIYNSADAFVLPSLQDNLPNTVMESLACGTPVIAFNIGGVPEMVKNNFNGYLVEKENEADLSQQIFQALYHKHPEQLQNNARQFVLEHYSQEKIASQYVQLYKQIIC